MPYVPGCRHDLFISYASENNREGWVEQFEKALGAELGELLGRQFNPKESVYFDRRELEAAQSFPDELVRALQSSAILVPILSPGYLTSAWCNRERMEFFSNLPHGAERANCLAPILIRPIDEAGLDALYRNAQRLSFLSEDGQTPVTAGSSEWTAAVRKFAGQVREALHNLRKHCKPLFLGKAPETDRSQNLRTWCRAELERRHFRTVPESLPALDDSDAVRSTLENSGLAIHFLGGADASAMEAIETSVGLCTGPTILYQPFGAELITDELLWLGDFERELQAMPSRYQRLAGKNDQELLALIDEQITSVQADPGSDVQQLELALVCEEPDLDDVRHFKEAIRTSRSVDVHYPDFLGRRMKAMEKLRKWQEYLNRSEALLFYYGLTDLDRLNLIWQKAQRDKPNGRRNWFLAPPDLDRKREQQPDALWNMDQVVRFLERVQTAHPV